MNGSTDQSPLLIVICGPTAVGKTALSIQLAKQLNTSVLSFDSRQFYRELNIGTAKPSDAELTIVPHHFINTRSVADPVYTAGMFETDALTRLADIFTRSGSCVAVGGSGLYIDALCQGIDEIPKSEEIRRRLEVEIEEKGLDSLRALLLRTDPSYFYSTDNRNPRRVIRGLEVLELTGKRYSELRSNTKKIRPFVTLWIGLTLDRQDLFERISNRVRQMIESGLETETRGLVAHRNCKALQTLGYREMFNYIDGLTEMVETIRLIDRNTRIYAKKQLTWFNRNPAVHWFKASSGNEGALEFVDKMIRT